MSTAQLFKGIACASVLLTAWSIAYVVNEPAPLRRDATEQESVASPSTASTPETPRIALEQNGAEAEVHLLQPAPASPLIYQPARELPAQPKSQSVATEDSVDRVESPAEPWVPRSPAQPQTAASPLRHSSFIRHPSSFPSAQAPGNSMEANGRRVAVEGVAVSPEGVEEGLELSINPIAAPEEAPAAAASKRWLARRPGGFTEEEELFRMRWGWEAFAKAQRLAVETR